MADKDIISKDILKRIALDIAIYLFKLEITDAELLDTEFQRVEDRRADLLLQVKAPSEYLLHIEVQNNNHPRMPLRMLRYLTDIAFAYPRLPIQQYLVYIGQEPLSMSTQLRMPNLHYEYRLIDMREIDCRNLLQQNNPDALVLAILCDFKGQNPRLIVRQIVQRLHDLLRNNEQGLREYFDILEILSGNRDLQMLVHEEESMLSAIKLSDLPSYQHGLQAGHQAGKHDGLTAILLRQLTKKFGQLPSHIEQTVRSASDQQLEEWAEYILTADTLDHIFHS